MTKIFVIAGHGAGDPGACGNGYQEAERVRVLANRIKVLGGNAVMLGDTSRNWYKDKGINSLTISKDYQIVELHMDSSIAKSAKGGHVIINKKFKADNYDRALASFISSILPGRSEIIVGKSNLGNANRAATKGYGYRLIECGFISNANDVNIFNNNIDRIATGILQAFGINPTSKPASNPKPTNKPTSSVLAVDGKGGRSTITKAQRVFGTTDDGKISNQLATCKKYMTGFMSSCIDWDGGKGGSELVKAIQRWAGCKKVDGYWGFDTSKCVQRKLGVTVDGYFGTDSMKAFQRWLNSQ